MTSRECRHSPAAQCRNLAINKKTEDLTQHSALFTPLGVYIPLWCQHTPSRDPTVLLPCRLGTVHYIICALFKKILPEAF